MELPSNRRDGNARASTGKSSEAVVALVGSEKLIDIDLEVEKLLDADLFEASGIGRLGARGAVRCALNRHGEYVGDTQCEEYSFHSMEKNEEYARFRTSPGPSRHIAPLSDLYDNLDHDQAVIEASQKAILDSDDERTGEKKANPRWILIGTADKRPPMTLHA
eukprot:2637758-Pyramimonas_sp.AAC.1